MKNRFGLLIAMAVSAACFSLSAVADPASASPASAHYTSYEVEITPVALASIDEVVVDIGMNDTPMETAVAIKTFHSGESDLVAHGSGSGDGPAYARTDNDGVPGDFADTRRPKNDGVRPNNDGLKTVNSFDSFEVGWQISYS